LADKKDTILARLLSRISDIYDKSVGSFFYDTQVPLAVELEAPYDKLEKILNNGFAATAEGEHLELKCAEQALTRKPATFAAGTVTLSGDVGANISVGNKVSSDTITFSVMENAVLTDGSADVAVLCDIAGSVGNLPVAAISNFPVTLSGITGVTNAQPTTGGYNAESDDDLRRRYFEKVSAPATSANKYHYILWAKKVTGVGDARVVPLWNGAGTVKVIIIDANRQPAAAELLAATAAYIEENRPIGAEVTVISAKPVYINISVTINKRDTLTDTLAEVRAALNEYIKSVAFVNSHISVAHIGGTILGCGNVADYKKLRVNGGHRNIPVGSDEVAVLGEVVINEDY
jgi:uncharacterized phage protein gp47/JayE